MAESSDNQNLFNCPICLHLLKCPVTTTCGHSFCMTCLNGFWDRGDQKGVYSCPQCRQTFSPRPALNRNTVLAEVVEKTKREAPEAGTASPVLSFAVSGDVECDICTETKLKAIKSCLTCLASYCESHIQTHYTSPALKWHKMVNASPHLLDQICSQHRKLLELYCCKDQQLICMQCALINHQNHSMTSPAAERQKIQVHLKKNQDGLQKEMRQREMKVQELRQAVDSHKCSAEAAVKHSEQMFTELISSMEKSRAEVTKMIRAQEKAEVSRVEKLILTLEQEVSDLRKRRDELGQLSQIEDDIYVIQNFSSVSRYQCSDLCNTSVSQRLTFEEIEKVISELKSQLDDLRKQDIRRISEKVPTVHVMVNSVNNKIKNYLPSQPKTREEFLIYSVDLNLKAPVSSSLSLKNNKSVLKCSIDYLGYEKYYQVLCKEKLSGRCYFEVQWEGAGCSIAFSYDNSPASFVFGSNKKSWKCDFPISDLRVHHNSQQTDISLVSKIGVFLDQAAGTVSFYNVSDKMTLLHRIQTTFIAPLYPGFSFHNLKNDSSVTICDILKLNK
ncbi:E3 ubiquitin/ISG15 ligase TRIM25-like [Onychostoma macrolepis]|uniref:E3 ubiquitin/ISG15 ligase TRIM25-like n=1 Tax=Onychostoma macrolepis TaxID=369639 RepID=UPI00272C3A04|nr:E3 ubiquitin/ISG15 ligase TRIM25-like [Onychostoma macrolepis]XP_058651038.1 E3 ubiquitin/ISG15 ligase TRIM25-like [Onychostoma macrolepis]